MKGVPTSCIEYYTKAHNISVKEIYSKLFNNGSIEFGLTNDNNKCVLETIMITLFLLYMKVRKALQELINL